MNSEWDVERRRLESKVASYFLNSVARDAKRSPLIYSVGVGAEHLPISADPVDRIEHLIPVACPVSATTEVSDRVLGFMHLLAQQHIDNGFDNWRCQR